LDVSIFTLTLTLTRPVRPYDRAATNTIFAFLQISSSFSNELSGSCNIYEMALNFKKYFEGSVHTHILPPIL
jgi:hypothetical protein